MSVIGPICIKLMCHNLNYATVVDPSMKPMALFPPFFQLNFLVTESRQREIVDQHCEGVQAESLDALISVAIQCVSSNPEDRPTMHRVVQVLESEVMTPCPSDFYDSSSD